jgi:hypothetical protein
LPRWGGRIGFECTVYVSMERRGMSHRGVPINMSAYL